MVALRALLLCDDVRVELGGTVSAIGVHSERLVVPPGDGPIAFSQLAVLAIAVDLRGCERVGWQLAISTPDGRPPLDSPQFEPHDPALDEHIFVSRLQPLSFEGPGEYKITVASETARVSSRFHMNFALERAPAPAAPAEARP